MLEEIILQLHLYNMLLVMAAGAVTAVWGLILFFRERAGQRQDVLDKSALYSAPTNPRVGRGVSLPPPLAGSPPPLAASSEKRDVPADGEKTENPPDDLPRKALNRPWRIALLITALLGALQALLGITLVLLGQKPPGGSLYYLHYVYGAIVALAIPLAVTYATGGKNLRRDILIYSLAAVILVAAGARALMTGLGLP